MSRSGTMHPIFGLLWNSRGASRVPTFIYSGLYVIAIGWLIAPTVVNLYDAWSWDNTYTHHYAIVLLAAWLTVRIWRTSDSGPCVPSSPGVAALLLATLGMLAGYASNTEIVTQVLLPVMLFAAWWAVSGWRKARAFAVPAGYLYFAMPFWGVLTEPLRILTTAVVSASVHAVGIPVFVERNTIHIPSGSFEVAGGCSGLNFLIVGLALATLQGACFYHRWTPRILLIVSVVAICLVANWVRVFQLVVVGHMSEMQHSLIVDGHYLFGWGVFVFFLALWFVFVRWLGDESSTPGREASVITEVRGGTVQRYAIASIALLIVGGGALVAHYVHVLGERGAGQAVALTVPEAGSWRRVASWSDGRRPVFIGATAEVSVWLEDRHARRVGVYLGYYATQRRGRELVFHRNRPHGEGARFVERQMVQLDAEADQALAFEELRVADVGGGERLVWFGMQAAGNRTTNKYAAKAYQALGVITGRLDAQAVVLSAACDNDCIEARTRLRDYTRQVGVLLYSCAALEDVSARGVAAQGEEGRCDAG